MDIKRKSINKKDICNRMDELDIRGWQNRNLSEKIACFASDYDINEKYFYNRWGSQKPMIEIKDEAKGLFYVLARTYEKDPFIKHIEYDRDKISSLSILAYYEEIIKCIDEELDDFTKYSIKNSYPYLTMIQEYKSIIKLSDKLSELSSAINKISQKARADFFLEMYKQIDGLINLAYKYEQHKEEQSKDSYDNRDKEYIQTREYEENVYTQFNIDNNDNISLLEVQNSIKNNVQLHLIEEDQQSLNISNYLAMKLKKILENTDDTKYVNLNEKIEVTNVLGMKIDELKEASKIKEELAKKVHNFTEEEYEQYKQDYRIKLMSDIDDNIKRVAEEYDKVVTFDKEYRSILSWIEYRNTRFNDMNSDLYSKEYYKGYLRFIEVIKKDKEYYRGASIGIIEEPIIRSKYRK